MGSNKTTVEDLFMAGKGILKFFNLLDSEGHLSITNLSVVIVLIKLIYSPSTSITEAGLLLITLSNYAHKRIVNRNNQESEEDPLKPQIEELQMKIEEMTSQVSAMSIQSGIKKLGN